MNRWTDFLVSFGVALFLHGLLVLGAVWFWTLRPPELRPVFQSGDVSLAVTFTVAAAAEEGGGLRTDDGRQTPDDGRQTTTKSAERKKDRGEAIEDPPVPKRSGGQAADNDSQEPETTDILTDPETEMPDPPAPERFPLREAASAGQVGGHVTDSAAEPPSDESDDQDELDAKPVAQVVKASVTVPVASLPNANQVSKSDAATSDALREGVNSAVRMQSEIRPYYPLGARLRGEEGAVTVRVWVKPSGRVSRSEVRRSSGFPALDEAAVDAARRARYVSTQPGVWSAEAETTLTFRFRLTD